LQRYLALPLADWRGWELSIDCGAPSCARGRRYSVANLADFYGRIALGAAVQAMRCAVCKGRVARAALRR
jgi:hypothetical protein